MKKIISLILTICMLYSINLQVLAEETDVEDILCSAFVVMEGKSESLVKNYYEELLVSPVMENEKIYVAAQDLEKWGTSVDISGNDVTIIDGAYTIEMTVGEAFYFVNNEVVLKEPFAENIDGNIMISLEDFANAAGLKYISYNNMGAFLYGADANEDLYDDIYAKISELKNRSVMAEIYVSTAGNDSGTGSKSNPFKTITRAKTYVQNLIRSKMTGDVYVYIESGIYNETLEFVSSDSGKGQYRVYYKGYNGRPEITTGKEITNWEEYNGNIYRAYIGEDRNINVLAENGKLSKIARYPNEDYLYSADGTKTEFYYTDELPEIADLTRVETYCWGGGGNAWAADTISVNSIDYDNKHITLNASASYAMSENSRFLLQGALELLDSPGEFFYDGEYLYYYPEAMPIAEQKIVIPNGNLLISFAGSSRMNPVKNITLSDLNISVTERDISAVTLESARNIEIENCKLSNIGKNAVQMNGYAVANRIEGCEITDIGKSGIGMSNTSNTLTMSGKNNEIINCHINGVGKLDGDTSGISIGTGYNLVKNCRIHDGKRMGISISSPRPGTLIGTTVDGVLLTRENVHSAMHSQNNHIMFCEIFDMMHDSQDGGAFYAWGGDYDNVVAYNHIHDTCSPFSFAFGIYIDDGSDRFTIKNNIVDNMKSYKDGHVYAAIFTKGSENKVINNIAANNESLYTFMTETMVAEPCDNLEYSKNIAYNSGSTGMYLHKSYGKKRMKSAENNIYYSDDKIYGITGITGITDLYEWQSYMRNKFDQFSDIDTNPLFYEAEKGDYRLKYNSEAFKNGIADIDKGEIGLTGNYPFSTEVSEGNIYLESSDKRIKGAALILDIDDELELNAYIRSNEGYKEILSDAEFTVSDESIAKVEEGRLCGLEKGTTTVTVSAKGIETQYDVIVGDEIKEIVVEGVDEVFVGDTVKLNAYAVTEFGGIKFEDIKYKSSDEKIATVDESCNITGISEGEVTVTVNENNKNLTSQVNIKIKPILIFSEDFEGDVKDRWNINDESSVKIDNSRSHDGNQSLAITRTTGSATFSGDVSEFGNYVYEFWMYDDLNVGTAVLEILGLDKDKNEVSVLFGVKKNAYSGSVYLGNQTNTTGVTRSAGWHQVVLDMTEDYKISVYIDGELTSISRGNHEVNEITGLKIHNTWYAGGTIWRYNFDNFRVWNKLENVNMNVSAIEIDSLNFYDENEIKHENIVFDKTVKITMDIKNKRQSEIMVLPIIVIYNEDKLKAVQMGENAIIEPEGLGQITINLMNLSGCKGLKYKIMLWDGMENQIPLKDVLSGMIE